MANPIASLTRVQKVAIFLTALGVEAASRVLRHFPENQAVGILREITDLHAVDERRVRAVLAEFQASTDQELTLRMGPDYAALLIQKSFGHAMSTRVMDRVDRQLNPPPFASLADMSGPDLADLLSDEMDQTCALVLAFLPPETAAEVIPNWPSERQAAISRCLMAMDTRADPSYYELEQVLVRKRTQQGETTQPGNSKALADILANVSDTAAERILSALSSSRPELADELRAQFFTFSDLLHLTDMGIRHLLAQVPMEDWAMALKGAANDVRTAVERNLSSRARERLGETMDVLGPQPRRLVDAARAKIVETLKAAEASGELVVRRGGDEYIP